MQKIAGFGEPCHVIRARGRLFALLVHHFRAAGLAGSNSVRSMSTEFVPTGQTFTQDGDAYCPVERKRRGPAALAASMSVLLVGAGFLAFAMFKTPSPNVAAGDPESIAAVETAAETMAETAQAENETQDAIERILIEEAELNVEDVLAESRAARSGVVAANVQSNDLVAEGAADTSLSPRIKPSAAGSSDDGMTPRLNPRRVASAEAATADQSGFGPRLKPAAAAEAPKLTMSVARARPAKIASGVLAGEEIAPPPFFFASDMERRDTHMGSPAIIYARDIHQDLRETRVRITRGENFVDTLKRAGVNAGDRNEAAYAFGKHYNLRQLRPGQEFELTLGWPNQTIFQMAASGEAPQARLIALDFREDAENRIEVRRNPEGGFFSKKKIIPLTTRILSVAGVIEGSLYLSAKKEGAPDKVIADLADAFAYDVDFQREIFGGDEFEAIFEARYDDQGELVSAGDIIFARLKWRGRNREKGYYRFASDADGARADFYDATGQSAKRLLMKTPIDGARLSSRFGTRKHPILGYKRAHKGVDFAASRGTPIKAAGDGIIERADRYGSFGNYVRIRHANGYKTAYAHLKGFHRGIRKGKRVRQGDIIGYVGTTGRSTGPHLHYEVHLNGKAVNPQRLKIATGKQLKGAELDRFKIQRDLIDAMRVPAEDEAALLARDEEASKSAL